MSETQNEVIVDLIKKWKARKTLVSMELLHVALKPLLDNAVRHHEGLGIRSDDVRVIARKLVEDAIESYEDVEISPEDWVAASLKTLPIEIERKKAEILQARATPSTPKG